MSAAKELMFVVPSFHLGGAERVITLLANGTAAHGVSTSIVTLAPDGPQRTRVAEDVDIIDLHRPRARHAALPLVRLIRARRPSAVMTSQTHLNALLALLAPSFPRGTRAVVRESELRGGHRASDRAIRTGQRTVYRNLDHVLVSSSWMANLLAGRHEGPITRIPNPVDVEGLRSGTAPERGSGPGRRFVHVGRMIAQKRVAALVQAFAAGAAPDDRLVLVGDGPERSRVEAEVARLGLTGRIVLTGARDEPGALIAGADALVLASSSEGMPNAVLEALALGTPVIAADDLAPLEDLVERCPAGSIRLVALHDLPAALAAVAPRSPTGAPDGVAGLRPTLLPEEHRTERVAGTLLELLEMFPDERGGT